MRRFGLLFITLVLLATLCVPTHAAGETTYRALLIGIDGYEGNASSGCVNDTQRMSATLLAANEAGAFYQTPTIRSNLQSSEILPVFTEIDNWNVGASDVTFLYFSGHGYLSDKGTPGIVGKDSQMVRIEDLVARLDQVPGTKVVVFDCRYSDSLLTKFSRTDGTWTKALNTFDEAVLDVFKSSPNASNYFVLAASTVASSVEEAQAPGEDARGLVTYYLTQGLGYDYAEQRPTDELPADANANGAVSLKEARDYIEAQILGLDNATDLVYDIQILPAGSAFPLLARRATAEVLDVTLEQGPIDVPIGRTRQLEAVTQPVNASKHTIYWTSTDLSVATVDETGAVLGIKPGTAKIAATTSNGLTVSTEVNVRDIKLVDTLALNVARLALGAEATTQLQLTKTPADASEAITWTSEDPAVATVDQEGNVTCVGMGETYITVASESGVEAACALQVVEKGKVVTSVEVDQKAVEIYEGESRNVKSRVKPNDAADPIVQFTSSDPSIAEISGESIITGVSPGTCTVYATASSGVSAQIKVTVNGATVQLNQTGLLLKEAGSSTLKAQVKPASLTGPIKWESSDEAVATVDENGKVTAVGPGVCGITASIESGASGTCRVMVGGTPARNVKVTPAKAQMDVGTKQALSVKMQPADAALESLVWSSNNEHVVQVDNTGEMTAVGPGKAIVTVRTINGNKSRCQVTVKDADGTASDISLDQSEVTLVAGLNGHNTYTMTPDTPVSSGDVKVQFASSNKKVATVNKDGVVTAKSPGKAIIRAKSGQATVDCNVTVVANQMQNKNPIVGLEEMLYTSLRQIRYNNGQLQLSLYYTNSTSSAMTLPEEGSIYLTLSDGTSLLFQKVNKGNRKLAAGKTGTLNYSVKVKQGDPLFGLDLRGASAAWYKPGEEPVNTGTPQTGDDIDANDQIDGIDDIDDIDFGDLVEDDEE